MTSTVVDRFTRWIERTDDGRPVAAFRRAFAGIWLVYDLVDLTWGMTERSRNWFPHSRDSNLVVLQLVLVSCGAMLVLGRNVWTFGIAAAFARGVEARMFFPLNDFHFGSVMYLLLAHSDGGPFARGRNGGALTGGPHGGAIARPKWVHDVLLVELAWIYFTTAALKLNPDWLGGGHLFVRTQYLALGHGWPYPQAVARALGNLSLDAALAKIGVVLEFMLGSVLLVRGRYWVGVGLALSIHLVGALLTNVWFFSASMVTGVALLLPRTPRQASAGGGRPERLHGAS